jgi:tyrosyl-tRNA synthetase
VDIGDPSGRTSARTPQAQAAKRYNIRGMKDQMKHLWRHVNGLGVRHGFPPQTPRERYLLLNHEWHQHVSALELIGTLGSGMRLGAMLNRDS